MHPTNCVLADIGSDVHLNLNEMGHIQLFLQPIENPVDRQLD